MTSTSPFSKPSYAIFGSNFLEDHARKMVKDPAVAITELVANCWDAGADTVRITWPKESMPELVAIEDNGSGMTYDEFMRRWRQLNYSRAKEQGKDVIFPLGNRTSNRTAYGKNGKGRHSMFCFANEYEVETWKDGELNHFKVIRVSEIRPTPFEINHIERRERDGHGTIVSAILSKNHLPLQEIHDLIGTKFITDPTFEVSLNGEYMEFTSLEHLTDTRLVKVPHLGTFRVSQVDTKRTSKTSQPHGVAWWVNRRLVGEVSWKGFSDEMLVDRRRVEGRRYTFIVEADALQEGDHIEEDWSGFKNTETFKAVQVRVNRHISLRLRELLKDLHQSRKRRAIEPYRDEIANLPISSRHYIGQTIDGLQEKLPSIEPRVLSKAVEVITNLEKSRTGYTLLEQLAKLDPNDLDALSDVLDKWSIQEARLVLGELERRLKLIEQLERLVEDSSSDELHDIHPLFENGLWIFGPEYESIDYTSNQSLKTVVTKLLDGNKTAADKLSTPSRRPDLVAIANSLVEVYSADSYSEESEVNGVKKVLILELKRGGFAVGVKELRQAMDYDLEIRRSGKVQSWTKIKVYILGTFVNSDVRSRSTTGETEFEATTYSVIIKKAKARTFHLSEKIKKLRAKDLYDFELEEIIQTSRKVG